MCEERAKQEKQAQVEALKTEFARKYLEALQRAPWAAAPDCEIYERLVTLVGPLEAGKILEPVLEQVRRAFYLGQ